MLYYLLYDNGRNEFDKKAGIRLKYSFQNDYSEGAHPKLLNALKLAGSKQNTAYGNDGHCKRAADLLRKEIGRKDVDIHFLEGGTQVNLTALTAFLRPHEAPLRRKPAILQDMKAVLLRPPDTRFWPCLRRMEKSALPR